MRLGPNQSSLRDFDFCRRFTLLLPLALLAASRALSFSLLYGTAKAVPLRRLFQRTGFMTARSLDSLSVASASSRFARDDRKVRVALMQA